MKKKMIRKVIAATACLAVIIAGCFIAEKSSVNTAELPEHDGEVLVDSLNIQEEAEPSDETQDTEDDSDKEDTEMVTSDDVSELEQSDSYFQEMRASINLDRNEVIAMLTDAEASADNSAEKDNASQRKMDLLDNMQLEQEVENAIAAKGLPECLVLITENGVNVTVNKQDLNDNDVAKICDIVMRETERNASQIIIQSKF
jgi:stage III sporulation protein AH